MTVTWPLIWVQQIKSWWYCFDKYSKVQCYYLKIIITDGIFQDKLAAYQYAKVARDEKDIKIFGIGVGDKDRFRPGIHGPKLAGPGPSGSVLVLVLKFQNLRPYQDRENLKIRSVDPWVRQLNEVSGGAENVFYHDDFSNLLQKISELKVVQFECFDEFKDFCKGKRHLKL